MTWNKKYSNGSSTTIASSSTNGKLNVNGSDITVYDDTTLKANSHTHSNKTYLDNLGDSNGALTYKGIVVATSASASTDPLYVGLLTAQQTFNLFDKSRMITGSHHDVNTGAVVAGGQETHAISVKPNYTYVFNKGDGISTQYSFYDSNGTYISGASATRAKAPSNAATMHVYINNTSVADVLMVMETNYFFADYIPYTQRLINPTTVQGWYRSKWYNKNWWVLGDSISTGWGDGLGAGNQYATKPYHYLLSRERFIRVQNDAVSGYTIGNIYDNKVVNMPSTAYAPDLITLMAGTNDHGFNITIGTINDDPATGTTFYARYRKTVEYLQTQYPYASIGLITPIQRSGTADGNVANAVGKTLRDYCDAIIAIGKYYSIPVLDIYQNLGFTPYNSTHKTNYYVNADGTHPNDKGHLRMGASVGDFIERI